MPRQPAASRPRMCRLVCDSWPEGLIHLYGKRSQLNWAKPVGLSALQQRHEKARPARGSAISRVGSLQRATSCESVASPHCLMFSASVNEKAYGDVAWTFCSADDGATI